MSSMQGPRLLVARPWGEGRLAGWQPATVKPTTVSTVIARASHRNTTGLIGTFPRDLFMPKWYCNPERPMSQSERLPS